MLENGTFSKGTGMNKRALYIAIAYFVVPVVPMHSSLMDRTNEKQACLAQTGLQTNLANTNDSNSNIQTSRPKRKISQCLPPLKRTFSFCPSTQETRLALEGSDLATAQQAVSHLPWAFVLQHGLYIKATCPDIRALILANIKAELEEKIAHNCLSRWEITHLIQELIQSGSTGLHTSEFRL